MGADENRNVCLRKASTLRCNRQLNFASASNHLDKEINMTPEEIARLITESVKAAVATVLVPIEDEFDKVMEETIRQMAEINVNIGEKR